MNSTEEIIMYHSYLKIETSLKNINNLRNMSEKNIVLLEQRLQRLIDMAGPQDVKAQNYEELFSNPPQYTPVSELYKEIIILRSELAEIRDHKAYLDAKADSVSEAFEQIKHRTEELSNSLNDLELKVFVMHWIKKVKLKEVSRTLNYSYDHIRYINSILKKKIKMPQKYHQI